MELVLLVVILVFSAIIHEVMHGFIAEKLGDPTARAMGRLTLNPLPHIDPFASILLPALFILIRSPIIFGAAKPVPVNPLYLKEGRKDLALVALGFLLEEAERREHDVFGLLPHEQVQQHRQPDRDQPAEHEGVDEGHRRVSSRISMISSGMVW